MDKFNYFLSKCQYKNNNSSIIIFPSVINTLLVEHDLNAKHAMVLCYSLLICWRNQPSWLGEQRPKLDSMLSRPLRVKMVELNYLSLSKTLNLTKEQFKKTITDLEKAKLLRRLLVKNKWYILLYDKAFKMYLNNNKSEKHRINRGNIISTSWLSLLKTDSGQTDFTAALVLGEITYFSRVLKRKQNIDDYNYYSEFDKSNKQVRAGNNFSTDEGKNFALLSIDSSKDNVVLVSKSKGLVAYFDHDHFRKKFSFLSSKVIDRTLSRLEKNNFISMERIKFIQGRKVIKRMYITPNYEMISKGVNKTAVNFVFKTDDYLNEEQLADFCQNTPSFIYNTYNNKTIIYPKKGFSSNFAYFSNKSKHTTNTHLEKTFEHTDSKKWYQVTHHKNINHPLVDIIEDVYRNTKSTRKCNQINCVEKPWIKKKVFRIPKYLFDMQNSLERLYRAYFAAFNYPISFCFFLLNSLAKKYPNTNFSGENQFITYFRKILAQERRSSWQVRSRKYFDKAKSLSDLAYDKLSNVLKEQLKKMATQAGRKIEVLPELLSKLAIRNTKHLFSCVSSFLYYMKQVLSKLKSKEEIQEAYRALPRMRIAKILDYLCSVEASYHRVGQQEHLRRKLACTLPMTVAYHLLSNCNFHLAKVDKDKNFIIPSKNKNWVEILRGGIKDIIKNQICAVYGQIRKVKFIQFVSKKNISHGGVANVNHTNTRSIYNIVENKTRMNSYKLFHQKRLEAEQKEKQELAAKMLREEGQIKQSNIVLKVYENYKKAMQQVDIEKEQYIKKGGEMSIAVELYKVISFNEWMQLQELIEMV